MYEVKQSPIDQQYYAVFKNEYDATKCGDDFKECPIAHFGAYENAYQLSYAFPKSGNVGS